MMTPNLDATGHHWVKALAQFNFKLEYQKGRDNTVADILSQVTTQLDPDMVRSIFDGVALGAVHWAKVHGPHHSQGWSSLRARGTCHHRPCTGTNACYWVDWSPERGPNVECSLGLAEGTEEDRFEDTSGRTCLQQRGPIDLTELVELHDSSGSPIPLLNAQGETKDCLLFVVPRAHQVATLMNAIGMQVIRAAIVPCPCYRSTSGGQEWLTRCNNPSSLVCMLETWGWVA